MSRSGWSTSNFLRLASAITGAVPLTMACWARTSIVGSAQVIGGIFTSGSIATLNRFSIALAAGNTLVAATSDGAGAGSATTTATITANTWFHACGVFAGIADRRVYLNGRGKATDTTSKTPSGCNRTSVGVGDGSAAASPFAPSGVGYIADFAIWGATLTDSEVAKLASGVSPLWVRRQSLLGFWPLRFATNEPNLSKLANTLVVQGALGGGPTSPAFLGKLVA